MNLEFQKTVDLLIENIEKSIDKNLHELNNITYETGILGASLFYFYYSRYKNEPEYAVKAEGYLTEGLSKLDLNNFKRIYSSDSLDNHLANIGRFLEFIKVNSFVNLDTNEYLSNLDKILHELMVSKISIGDFDLNSGALAAGYYFLSRSQSNSFAAESLSILVKGIENKAFIDNDGDFYWTSPSLYNRIYLGLSHGSSMIIAFISNVYNKGIEKETCKMILLKAVNFVLKSKRTQLRGLFPLQLNDKVEPKQFALCYGDLGVGYALYCACGILNDKQLSKITHEVLQDCLKRKREDNLTLDSSIIYGASGLAITFQKLYNLTNDEDFNNAARYWFEQIPEYAINQNDFSGFKSRLLDAEPIWNIAFGFGIIGTGISLMISVKQELPPLEALTMIA